MPMDCLKEVGTEAHHERQAFGDAIAHALDNEREAEALSRAAYDDVFFVPASRVSRDEALTTVYVLRCKSPFAPSS